MKKLFSILLILITVFCLSACFHSKRTNYFLEGVFVAQSDGNDYYLEVKRISKEEFGALNGKNAVEDTVINEYFQIRLYLISGDEVTYFDFYNLKDLTPVAAEPAAYTDDNNNGIMPFYKGEPLPVWSPTIYSVSFNEISLSFDKEAYTPYNQ